MSESHEATQLVSGATAMDKHSLHDKDLAGPHRKPLANISAKMHSPSSGAAVSLSNTISTSTQDHDLAQAQFGKVSPLRNPLLGQHALSNPLRAPSKSANLFIDKNKDRFKPKTLSHKSHNPSGTSRYNASKDLFDGDADDAIEQLRAEMNKQPKTVIEIAAPKNRPIMTAYPKQQIFSSAGFGHTLSNNATASKVSAKDPDDQDSDDEFDPDAGIRTTADRFGAADPYMYQDSDRANSNIKNLLEGAFDDDEIERPRGAIRTRRLPALRPKPETESTRLADKLSALSVSKDSATSTDEGARDDEISDGIVEGLTVRLLPHQIDGVDWMISKESGERKNGVLPRGGILADDMGLGKTVQSVALILLNPKPALDAQKTNPKQKLPSVKVEKCTLVVAPLALIRQWEDEIRVKVARSHALKVLVHHGTNRTKSSDELKKYDVVVTTYQILTSEYAASDFSSTDGKMVGCFGVHWYRLVLDEAHSIKNRNAKSSIACCSLRSWNRWCLTGTPMQNNLDELQSLIKFLRIKPYCELASWKQQIIQPIKSGRGGLAMARLHHYLNTFMKRRTKDILKKDGALGGEPDGSTGSTGFRIVKREVVNVECRFNEQEQAFYDRLSERANNKINAMIKAGGKTDYMGALVLLLRLRQACNHPALVEKTIDNDREAVDHTVGAVQYDKHSSTSDLDDLADLMGGMKVHSRDCDICGLKLSDAVTKAGQSRCDDCAQDLQQLHTSKQIAKKRVEGRRRVVEDSDEHEESDDQSGFSSSPDDASTDLQLSKSQSQTDDMTSTKVCEIVDILKQESKYHKTIIFSQFTSMLDVIQPHIRQRFVRYDGSMRPEEREKALSSLRNDVQTRVLLCSLKCGSLGLNLTAASRVIIVEPFWNPFVEEQAIDRVHRLNQTVDVKVYRLTIAGSVEERILALQEKKRALAAAAIEGGQTAGKLSMNDILGLFRSDAQTADMHEMDRKFAEKIGYDSKIISGSQSSPVKPHTETRPMQQHRGNEHQVYGRRW